MEYLKQSQDCLRENIVKQLNGSSDKEWADFVARCGAIIDQETAKHQDTGE